MEQIDKKSRRRQRDYVSYKSSCDKADEEFKQYDNLRELSIEQLQEYYGELNKQYVYTKKCYEGREEFKLKHVPEDERDEAHDITISIYRRKANELTGIMARVSRQIERKLQEQQEVVIEVKEPLLKVKETQNKPKRSKGRKKSKSKSKRSPSGDKYLDQYLESAVIHVPEQIEEPIQSQNENLSEYERAILFARERLYAAAGEDLVEDDQFGPLQIMTQMHLLKLLSSMEAEHLVEYATYEISGQMAKDCIKIYKCIQKLNLPYIPVLTLVIFPQFAIYVSEKRVDKTLPIISFTMEDRDAPPNHFPYQMFISLHNTDLDIIAKRLSCRLLGSYELSFLIIARDFNVVLGKQIVKKHLASGENDMVETGLEAIRLYYSTSGRSFKDTTKYLQDLEDIYMLNKDKYQ